MDGLEECFHRLIEIFSFKQEIKTEESIIQTISVIIPVCNCMKYILHAIDFVLN